MSYIKNEDVRGVKNYDGSIICVNCVDHLLSYKEKDLILERDIEQADGIYYCDVCEDFL